MDFDQIWWDLLPQSQWARYCLKRQMSDFPSELHWGHEPLTNQRWAPNESANSASTVPQQNDWGRHEERSFIRRWCSSTPRKNTTILWGTLASGRSLPIALTETRSHLLLGVFSSGDSWYIRILTVYHFVDRNGIFPANQEVTLKKYLDEYERHSLLGQQVVKADRLYDGNYYRLEMW